MFRLVTLSPVRAPKTAWQFWSKLQWSCFYLLNRIPLDWRHQKEKKNVITKKESKQTATTTTTSTRWSLKLDGYCQTKTAKQKNKIVAERRWPLKYDDRWNTMTVQRWLQDESECLINILTMFNYMKLTTKTKKQKQQQQQKVTNTQEIKIMVCRWLVSPLLFVSVCDAAAHKDCISKSSACLASPGQRAKFPGTSPFRPNVNLRNPFGKSASTNTPPSTLSPDLSKSRKTSAPARMRAGWWSW